MKTNVGETKIKTRRGSVSNLQDFDRLPQNLREWLRNAFLPWRPSSVQRVYNRALAKTGRPCLAIAELERLQKYQIAKDRKS